MIWTVQTHFGPVERQGIRFSKNYLTHFFLLNIGVGASFFGEILQPQGGVGGVGAVPGANGGTGNGTGPGGKLVSGDLDASLANLTSNLNLGAGQAK